MESSRLPRRQPQPRLRLLERAGFAGMDGWLAFSALGLLACSLFTLY